MERKVKFAVIGAGSSSFGPNTVMDILLSEPFARNADIEIYLMDISQNALDLSAGFCRELQGHLNRTVTLNASTCLKSAVEGADFVITSIEVDRHHHWSQDFHIPKRFGFRQVYGENGGPGGMFHFLRNVGPLHEIAKTMEAYCPDAWLLNFTNPEAKLIEAVSKMSTVKCVGLCHGIGMAEEQLSGFLEIPAEDLAIECGGLNHFCWVTKLTHAVTGEDLYPLLREKESKAQWLAQWDELALPRLLFRTFGLYPYPGTNHVGEYIAWGEDMLASRMMQYFYDPAECDPWKTRRTPDYIYSLSSHPTGRPLFTEERAGQRDAAYVRSFTLKEREIKKSGEFAIPIAEAITFDAAVSIGAVNIPNKGYISNIPDGTVVELPAVADGRGLHPKNIGPLPVGIACMIHQQGCIHQLLVEAYREKSRNKLLQALLVDPTVSTYHNAVMLINTMCDMQKDILPELSW